MVRRERFGLQTPMADTLRSDADLSFARFAISQSKFPRANCLSRTLRKEKIPIRLLPAHDTGMNGRMNGPTCWGQAAIEPHPPFAALQDFDPDIEDAAIDHSRRAHNARERRVLAWQKSFSLVRTAGGKHRTSVTAERRSNGGPGASQCADECTRTRRRIFAGAVKPVVRVFRTRRFRS